MSTDLADPTVASSSLPDPSLIPDITLDTELVDESQPFLGVIVLDEYQPNYNKDGYQWVLGVRPVDFVVKGELACFFCRAAINTSPASKMGIVLGAFQKVYGREKQPIGRGHLRGRIGVFVNRNVSFGTAPDGSERKARVTIPVRRANDEEIARAQPIADAILAGQAIAEHAPAQAPALPPTFTDDQLRAMLSVVEGKTPSEFQLAAISSGLEPPLLNAILSGAALTALKAANLIALDDDGRVTSLAVPF